MSENETGAPETKKTSKTNGKTEKIARIAAKAADERKAEDVLVLNMEGLTVICDYFVICTGNSMPHLKAIAESITDAVRKELAIKPRAMDGETGSKWIVIDFGSVIIHILSPEMREFYRLENLWGDAPRMLDFIQKEMKK